ncbi:DsrE/DsrF/DrsH-like family protein [Alicyclobacillus sendaiensis]|uniref:DsrE/DsrF/DrsH-like family protein n=1 Tax=Alicyclobacillus sendaiensis PA2 TaxID=3029425 RepID=A0ABT6XV34_ALISE|nr:DsrE/DsrF/DrsH-like family protein [Alicyclobacillus sendaiensis]MDI9258951.1 DsrE/DsrF/DrsH-like family protein [Alicyclobacillus sendaiensis PA2]
MSKKVAIIASNGGLETAYKVLNIAMAGVATDAEVAIFFTFEGLNIIHKNSSQLLRFKPENEPFAENFKKHNVPSIQEMLQMAKESGVRLIACQMTVDVMGLKPEDFIDGVEFAGAVNFLDFAYDADVTVTF